MRRMIRTYRRTLPRDRRNLLESYRYVHAARKVVGVGSVGTRAWILLMVGRDNDDPLFLQFKEAQASVLEPFLGKSQYAQHGQRVVEGQRMMQAAPDIMLGWERIVTIDGEEKDFYIRQLWDAKGSADVELMDPPELEAYGRICGWTLASAHARSGDRIAIAAYLGTGAPSTAPWPRSPRRTPTRTIGTTARCRRPSRRAASARDGRVITRPSARTSVLDTLAGRGERLPPRPKRLPLPIARPRAHAGSRCPTPLASAIAAGAWSWDHPA